MSNTAHSGVPATLHPITEEKSNFAGDISAALHLITEEKLNFGDPAQESKLSSDDSAQE